MESTVLGILAIDVALVAISWPAARWLHPRTAARLLVTVAVVVALTFVAALVALAAGPIGTVLVSADLGRWSAGLGTRSPIPAPLEAAAVISLLIVAISTIRTLTSEAQGVLRASRLHRACSSDAELIVVDSDAAVAFALPGRTPHIVVSRTLLRSLSAEERRALLAHERAHLHFHHWAYQGIANVAAGLCPLLLPLRRRTALAVERWADEAAAGQVLDRILVARSLSRVGLLAPTAPSPIGALAFGESHVQQRVRALLVAAPAERRWPAAPPVVLSIVAAVLAIVAASDFERLLELAVHARAGL